jgi:hypothetical protein
MNLGLQFSCSLRKAHVTISSNWIQAVLHNQIFRKGYAFWMVSVNYVVVIVCLDAIS